MSGPREPLDAGDGWDRVQALFHAALERPAAGREAYLRDACGGDAALLARVRAMLDADAGGGGLLDRGLEAAAGDVLAAGAGGLPRIEFGPYRVTGVLGEGGMGVVYRARRVDLASEAAIKVLRDATLSPARRERFAFEQRALAQLNHPAIARLYDAGALPDGTPWFAMELVEGETITDYCRARHLSVEARLALFREVCEAVQHAHAHAIIHRDLKPSNILVRPDGRPKLLDFGIAKPLESLADPGGATRTGLRLMTPAYAAPEQVLGRALGVHTDVYSLGVVLYELLTGRLPFDLAGCSPSEAAARLTQQAPARPSALVVGEARTHTTRGPGRSAWNDLDVLCLTAMHADPARRYHTVDALVRDLERYLAGLPLEARGDSVRYRTGKFVRRHATALSAAALALATLVAVVTFFTLWLAAARDAARAEAARAQRIQGFLTDLLQGGDKEAGPADTLRVVTLLDRGVRQAGALASQPAVRAQLERTLGTSYESLGRLPQADTLLAASLEHSLRLAPRNDADVARALRAMALLRVDQSRFAEAETFARRALELSRRTLAPTDPEIADATATLGRVLEMKGAYEQALPVLAEAARRMAARDSSADELATVSSDLADTYFYLGRLAESDSLNGLLLARSRRLHGPGHPDGAQHLLNLAASQEQLGHYAESERLCREALGIFRAWYGEDSPHTADAITNLARPLIMQARYAEADSVLHEALAVEEKAYGPMHHLVAGVLNELGNAAMARPDGAAQAAAYFGRAADIYRHNYGAHSGPLGVALSNLGHICMVAGDNRRAEEWFRRALAAYDGAVPPGHPNVAISRIKLGRVLMRQKRYAEGERETLAGYRILVAQKDPGTSFLKAARTDLVADYEGLHRPADAARFRAELADTVAKR